MLWIFTREYCRHVALSTRCHCRLCKLADAGIDCRLGSTQARCIKWRNVSATPDHLQTLAAAASNSKAWREGPLWGPCSTPHVGVD